MATHRRADLPVRTSAASDAPGVLFGSFDQARQPGALFVPHLVEAETRADGDNIQDRVRCIGGQSQPVKFLPNADADIRRVAIRVLSLQILAPLLHTFGFLQGNARAV